MAAEDGVDTLKLYWDHFFKAETGTYEKSTWLDLFLAEFLIRINNGANAKELINFCPVSGVVTLVGCELLCGIHRVTSSINTHYSPLPTLDVPCSGNTPHRESESDEKEEEPRIQSASLFARANAQSSEQILRQYLLGGVAWRCLVLLRALGVEGLSCCRQLSSVLIWLFGELSSTPSEKTSTAPPACALPNIPRTPIHQLFSNRIWAKQRASSQGSKTSSNVSPEKTITNGRARVMNQHESPDGRSKRKAPSELSSDSADSNDDLELLNRSLAPLYTLQVPAPNDHFQYFNSSMRSSNEYPDSYTGSFHSPRKQKTKVDDHMTDKHKEIINSEIAAFEFTLLIMELLQELCRTESSLSGSEGSQISMQCINFALRTLCSLQFGSSPDRPSAKDANQIKAALTELLMVSLDKVLVHSDLCAKLINSGVLPMLLRILEDVITKRNKDDDRAKQTDKTESDNLLRLVFGVAYSIAAFFHCLLMQCRSVDKLREFTDQFKLYGECLRGGLMKDCIELMMRIPLVEEAEVVVLVKKLIETVGKLINGMKRVRSEVMHSAACTKYRHKICRRRVSAGMHHHHDILGEAGNGLPMSSACCISIMYGTLTALLADEEVSGRGALRNKILRMMLNCGVCCCFPPGALMESLVRLMLTHGSAAAPCLQLLEHAVYGELGAAVLLPAASDQLPCSVCEPRVPGPDAAPALCRHPLGPLERKNVCSFLIHYNSLLQLDNHNNVLHATVTHLLRVTPRCRSEMKYELLFSVIYPTFIVAKHRYMMRLEESAYFLTVSCLDIFAGLLNTVSFAEQFIQKGGLSYVLELVSLPEFSNRCCSILEIAIVVEIFKLIKENSDMIHHREMSTLSSVQMLFKSLSEMTDRCFKIYKLKLPASEFEKLTDLTEERASLSLAPSVNRVERRVSAPQNINYNSFASAENTVEHSIEDHLDVLKNIWTFWKTCAGLCLYSPMFREYLVGESVLLDSYGLLKVVLYYLRHSDCGLAEMRILIKLLEALLTVQLSVSEVTSNRSKTTSCRLVRAALVAEDADACAGGVLRPLCEALVRVAGAEPSRHHAMPRLAHAKVPPLVCPSGSSSAECSSSEESVPAVYASEHSDPPHRPDEGYEADVEIGKFDLLPPYKNRKMPSTLSSINTLSGQAMFPDTLNIECSEYTKNGELAHPELCIIVVDILTQLIDKVVSSKSKDMSAIRAGAALARACCARLAGAGGAVGHTAPALLQRLLAAPATHALLASREHHLDELQRSVVEVVCCVGSRGVEAGELRLLLRLVTSPHAALAPLLHALRALVPTQHHTPDHILAFPVATHEQDESSIHSLSDDFVHMTMNGVSSQSHVAEASARKLHAAHTKNGITSTWSVCGVRCGVEGVGWAPWMHGFSLLLWLRNHTLAQSTDESSECSEPESDNKQKCVPPVGRSESRLLPAHVLSVGHDSLMFEIWLDNGELTFRLTRPELSCNRIISEDHISTGSALNKWACIALNVQERVQKKRMFIQVTVFVNGYEYETVSLPIPGILVRKVTATHVLLGHVTSSSEAVGGYHLASCAVYRSPVLDTSRAMHLTAHGCDSSCMVRCEAPNYPSLLTPEVLDSNIDWDQVYEMSSSSIRELHDNMLLSFSASAPTIINLYHQTAPLPPVFPGRASPSAASPGVTSRGASIPETLYVTSLAALVPLRSRSLPAALALLHPVHVLLYLYARVVELEGTALEQAQALGILLQTCAHDDRLYAAFHELPTIDMLLSVFCAAKCQLHPHLLKVILESACSNTVVRVTGSAVSVVSHSDAVVLEPRLLLLLARAAQYFDATKEFTWDEDEGPPGQGTLWALTLRCLLVLVRAAHPRRTFNHYQLTRVELMHHLLLACKERFLNSDSGPMSSDASESFVSLIRGLTGEPPLLHRLALLCDFLLLMHQASDTFVTHSRANFYFLLTSETQEMSDYNSLLRKKGSKGYKRRQLTINNSSEELTTDNSLYSNKNTGDSREDSDKMESSMESTKQIKGIINLQLKEGRKQNVSSTSENSDTTPELAEGSESDGKPVEPATKLSNGGVPPSAAGDLTEYIVVDADDVNHTTVEMYSSGIYHQEGRVRAGAAPGWAGGAALLLLLRDAIALLPDHQLQQAVQGAIQCEVLVVLANQRCSAVRAAVVRVLAALQRRTNHEYARKLRAVHYYIHLANQISLYEGSWELAAACAALITKCDVTLEDQLDDDIWMDVTEESLSRSPPLLAILPRCLHEPALTLAILNIMKRIVHKASLKLLNEVSLVEVLIRCIRALGARGDTAGEGEGEEEGEREEDILDVVYEVLIAVALKALSAHHSMQSVVDIHHMVSYIECTAGESPGVVTAARDAQAALYCAQLDCLEEKLLSSYNENRTGNYFANVLTSAVSLGSNSGGGRGELGSRLGAVASRAVSFLLTLSPAHSLPPRPLALLERLLRILPTGMCNGRDRPKWWVGYGAEWGGALQELVTWALSGDGAGPVALRALYAHHPPAHTDPNTARKLAVYVVSLLKSVHQCAETGGARLEYAITDWARDWAVSLQADLPQRLPPDALRLEAQASRTQDAQRWARAQHNARPHRDKVVFSKESMCGRVSETAMQTTRAAVETQNSERKRFMEQLRRAGAAHAAAAARWDKLVQQHTHLLGIFHDPRSYPHAWSLDPTEGAGRVRVRLRRAAMRVHPRFLKPQHRHKAECNMGPAPLSSVVGGGGWSRGGVVARLQLNETVSYMARAVCVTVAAGTSGELLLSDRCIHFVPDDTAPAPTSSSKRKLGSVPPGVEPRPSAQSWELEQVTRVETRRWCLQEVAVELFLSTGHAHLVAFADLAERTAFLKALGQCHLPYRMEPDSLSEAMSQWRSGAITNWEYLMRLNGLAGRSYNDLMQYPVLPFILADYSSRILDLDAPASFRDLSRPVAVQNKAREQHYINNYNDLKVARREGSSPLLSAAPHHYASLYSNSGAVLHYLLRVPPFTELFLNYQDNNFDMPDRTFHSLATTWRLITQDSHTDVKELIPEMFYLPELFQNNEGLNFGRRQCGESIDCVELPAWAGGDARLFTLVHRQALEARAVTEALPAWIDLVFGYKQTGQPAIDAVNVFPACTYYGFDPGALEDAGDRVAAAAMVRTYGQAPRRLLRAPHPHAHRDLTHAATPQPLVWSGVQGACWGRYSGAAGGGAPACVARRAVTGAACVRALRAARAAIAAAPHTTPLALYGDTSSVQSGSSPALALVSWGHSDNIVRLKRRRDAAPDLLLHTPALDQITCVAAACVSEPAAYPLFVGHASGRILCVRVRCAAWAGGGATRAHTHTHTLLAHAHALADMHVCASSALLASASVDGTVVLWDLNSLTFIRTVPNRDMLPVTHVTVSATLSDVATVHDLSVPVVPVSTVPVRPAGTGLNGDAGTDADAANDYEKDVYKYKSLIRVHTCNAVFVGSVKVVEQVTSICYSHAAEGVSVNSVAAGLHSGGVRFYSSWDLTPTVYLPPADDRLPLVSLRYSSDSSVLFGCYSNGVVVAWESSSQQAKPAPVRILPAHALY